MNCSTASSRSGHYNTHLYHPYSRNGQVITQSGQESSDALKSFNQQLGINCSVNQLNAGVPVVSSNSYSGLLATVSKPHAAYNPFDHSHFGHLNNLSHSLSLSQSNSLNGQSDSNERRSNGLHALASQHLNYSNQLDQLNFNQLNHSDRLTHLAENGDNSNYSSGNQTSVIVCNTKISDESVSALPTMVDHSANPAGAFSDEGTRLENDDEIDFVMAYISSSQDEQRKIYSNQNSASQTELTIVSHQINKENHNQLINNPVCNSFSHLKLSADS